MSTLTRPLVLLALTTLALYAILALAFRRPSEFAGRYCPEGYDEITDAGA